MTRRARTALIAVVLAAWASSLGASASAIAATTVVNGVIVSDEQLTLSPDAVEVVTLVDQTATDGAGAIVGQQRIDGVTSLPIAFEVLYDDASIDDGHSYALFASIVDGDSVYQSIEPVPVITGGPKVNVELPVAAAPKYPGRDRGDRRTTRRCRASRVTASRWPSSIKEDTGTVVSVATGRECPASRRHPVLCRI